MPTVRTRYAPSPTGYLHVGGLRTALYNYLYARQHGGHFILRIEDTDQTRQMEGAVENLLAAFAWAGLDFDEGPFLGGPYGPYVQSERLDVYREHLRRLAQSGAAYPCFCTPEILKRMRQQHEADGRLPMYDRRCRALAIAGAQSRIDKGEPHVWRMAVPFGKRVGIRDLVRGEVRFETATLDDQILMKSDGFPTYHLANVVDDHLMRVSHVIRGEEWLPSTPKHVLLYEAFGWDVPPFAHLPLLLNPDRSKMSKRAGDVAVEDYRRKGTLPQALINFVALLGWHPTDERELFSLADLIREFSLERVSKAGAVFDVTKLRWMNAEYVKAESDEQLYHTVRSSLEDLVEVNGEPRVKYAVATLRGGAESFEDVAERVRNVFAPVSSPDPEMQSLLDDAGGRTMLMEVLHGLESLDGGTWSDFAKLETVFRQVGTTAGQGHGLKGKHLWRTLRAALTGQPHGPELGKLVGIWGRERVLAQLAAATQPHRDRLTTD